MRPSRALIVCSLAMAPLAAQAQIAVRVTTDPDGGPGMDVLSSGTTRVHVFADGVGAINHFIFDLTDSGPGLTFTNLTRGPVLMDRLDDADTTNDGFLDDSLSDGEFGWSAFIGPALMVTGDTRVASFDVNIPAGPAPGVLSLAGPAWGLMVDGITIDDSTVPGSGDALVLSIEATATAGGGGGGGGGAAAPPAGGIGNTVPPISADTLLLDDGPVIADPRQAIQFVAVFDPIAGTLEIGELLDGSDVDTTITRDPDGAAIDGTTAMWDADGGVITATGLFTAGAETGEFFVRLSLFTGPGTLLAERVVLVGGPTLMAPADQPPDDTTQMETDDVGSPTPVDEAAPTAASSDDSDAALPISGLCGAMGMVEMLTLCLGLGLFGRSRGLHRHCRA